MSFTMFFTHFLVLSLIFIHLSECLSFRREVKLNNQFAVNLLQTLNSEENTFFSPLSLSSTLLTLLNGAEGETEKELRRALDLQDSDSLNEINSEFKQLLDSLDEKNSKDITIRLLTRLLVAKQSEGLKEEFLRSVRDSFKGEVKEVDFKSDSKLVTRDLNEWISDKTDQKINRLFRDNLDSQSSLVLTNVVYFSAKWRKAFNRTEKRDFHNFISYQMPGLATSIPFMTTEDSLRTKSVPQLKSTLLELPYAHNLSMVLIIPNSLEDLQFLNENMTSNHLNNGLNELFSTNSTMIKVIMPKFKLDMDYDMKESFEEIFELKTLFSKPNLNKAFKQQKDSIKMSQTLHRASIDVNEEGTLAATNQYLSIVPQIVIDRPFVFAIVDTNSGLISFMGRVQTLVDDELLGLGFI